MWRELAPPASVGAMSGRARSFRATRDSAASPHATGLDGFLFVREGPAPSRQRAEQVESAHALDERWGTGHEELELGEQAQLRTCRCESEHAPLRSRCAQAVGLPSREQLTQLHELRRCVPVLLGEAALVSDEQASPEEQALLGEQSPAEGLAPPEEQTPPAPAELFELVRRTIALVGDAPPLLERLRVLVRELWGQSFGGRALGAERRTRFIGRAHL